jgi:apolipoprotein N-acyltransferase
MKPIILSLISSAILILSFPRPDLGFLAMVGLLPLFFAIEGKSPKASFRISYLCGFVFFLGTIYWLMHVTLLGMILLCMYLALYFGLAGFLFCRYSRLPKMLFLFVIPAAWTILEYLRAHLLTGFGWALLGYSQYEFLPLIQISDMTGVYGVSFFVVFTNTAIYLWLKNRRKSLTTTAVYSLLAVIVLSYGFVRLRQNFSYAAVKLSIIQGNIPQEWKWEEDKKQYILEKYFFLTSLASRQKPDLIIWPETAFPAYLWLEPQLFGRVIDFVKEIKQPLLMGLVTLERGSLYNSAILFSKTGEPAEVYHKIHLVPFGEYIPLRKMLPFLETIVPIGDFAAGKAYTVFKEPAPFSVLICFEDTVPELSRGFVLNGARCLVNITNDAWFKDTSAPYQHLQASVFRAVENRRWLVRAANTGISGFIGPAGDIAGWVQQQNKPTFVDGFLTGEIGLGSKLTFYTRFGDLFAGVCCLLVLAGFIFSVFRLRQG